MRRWRLVLAALMHLVVAKLLHLQLGTPEIRRRLAPRAVGEALDPALRADLGRALAGVARRLPWRSDCLIQAMAARRWLDRLGAPSELRLGARRGDGGALEAHAWLVSDGAPVTGGRLESGFAAFAPPAVENAADPAP